MLIRLVDTAGFKIFNDQYEGEVKQIKWNIFGYHFPVILAEWDVIPSRTPQIV